MEIRRLAEQSPFTTADGSTIRSLLDRSNAPVQHQSLAAATLQPGQTTTRHHHAASEEFYYILEGQGLMEINGQSQPVHPGDAILIPPGARHQIHNPGPAPLHFLCCCAPPYAHDDTLFD